MNKINLLITEANGNLSDKKEKIYDAVKETEKYVFPKLGINWDIDLLITNRLNGFLISEDGMGGRTRSSDFIEFAIDDTRATKNLISEMVAHELCHAARWGKNDEWANTLFDCAINEGIATYYEAEYVKDRKEKSYFITTILRRTDDENRTILKMLQNQFDLKEYDYDLIFYNGNDTIPRWAGYSLGYYLVKEYLEETNKAIENSISDKYAEFKKVLGTFLSCEA